MNDQDSWHDQDAFWEPLQPVLFNQERRLRAKAEMELTTIKRRRG
jgi:hypothetical protein